MRQVDVIIPTYKPDKKFLQLMERLEHQTLPPRHIIVMNTEQKYFDRLVFGLQRDKRAFEVIVKHLSKREFDHGRTRNQGVKHSQAEVFMLMTDDAVPADDRLIEKLVGALDEEGTAVAYARQLPDENCGEIERFIRNFNYPETGERRTAEDIPRLGIKTFFCSNVCAAYRRDVFDRLGGFVNRAIFNEDMIYASKAVRAGYAVAYVPEARVVHSHHYTAGQQFHRNFDLGVSQADHPEVFAGIRSESEGVRMVRQAAAYLRGEHKTRLIPKLIVESGCKYIGFLLGRNYRRLPKKLVMACTMDKEYWRRQGWCA